MAEDFKSRISLEILSFLVYLTDEVVEMNVKSAASQITSLDQVNRSEKKENVKTFESADRDARNQNPYDQPQEEHKEFTEQEWEEAIEKIKALPAVKKNNLQVSSRIINEKRIVEISTIDGQVIRRLNEQQVWQSIQSDQERPQGQLLNKAM